MLFLRIAQMQTMTASADVLYKTQKLYTFSDFLIACGFLQENPLGSAPLMRYDDVTNYNMKVAMVNEGNNFKATNF